MAIKISSNLEALLNTVGRMSEAGVSDTDIKKFIDTHHIKGSPMSRSIYQKSEVISKIRKIIVAIKQAEHMFYMKEPEEDVLKYINDHIYSDVLIPNTDLATIPKDKEILIKLIHGKYVEFRVAMYFSPGIHEADAEWLSDDFIYDENTDTYYCPEGWYEKGTECSECMWWRMGDYDKIVSWYDLG